MHTPAASLKAEFAKIFGTSSAVHVVRAPGRVNLIGEHTDYNDGFVFPMAIEPEFQIACRKRDDGIVKLASTSFPGEFAEFSLNGTITRGTPKWSNYSRGVAHFLKLAGVSLVGMDALITNTLPVGGGLSSSAALEVGTATALLLLAGQKMDPQKIALISQQAEHEFALVPCGIMDQTIVATGKADHALLLDCRDLSKQYIPLDGHDVRVVIVNSMVKHELSGGEYGERRKQCEEATAFFAKSNPNIKALRDVTMSQVESAKGKLSDLVFRRARHVVGEIERTTAAAKLLTQRRYTDAGKLMVQSHNSLRDDYEVSVPELDYLVEQSMTIPGVYGARMTGGGFGGCIVALVKPDAVDALQNHLLKTYPAKYQHTPGIFVTTATDGASVLE